MNWIKTILKKVNRNSKCPNKQLQFGYLLVLLFVVLFCVSIYKKGWQINDLQCFMIIFVVVCFLLTIFLRKVFYPLLFLWLLFGEFLGNFTNYVILGIIYYLIFSPLALILNISNKKNRYKATWLNRKESIDYESLS